MKLPLPRDMIYTPQQRCKLFPYVQELAVTPEHVIFTLRKEKGDLISLQQLFIDYTVDDPTETEFALAVFGDVAYWLEMRESIQVKPHVEKWREECDIRRKAMAYKAVINEVKTQGRSSFSAAKFLIEEKEKDKRNPKTKEQVEKTSKAAREYLSSDLEAIENFLN